MAKQGSENLLYTERVAAVEAHDDPEVGLEVGLAGEEGGDGEEPRPLADGLHQGPQGVFDHSRVTARLPALLEGWDEVMR